MGTIAAVKGMLSRTVDRRAEAQRITVRRKATFPSVWPSRAVAASWSTPVLSRLPTMTKRPPRKRRVCQSIFSTSSGMSRSPRMRTRVAPRTATNATTRSRSWWRTRRVTVKANTTRATRMRRRSRTALKGTSSWWLSRRSSAGPASRKPRLQNQR
ncbi:MAG: hypothetical protein A3K59_06250 [Euryarchaeota archaeon RBG_19FT_COMBO_69_17]|nr:MAG: hypothetical protein A3K59_06250 [Euryarchaeota archaeon RBG_19FT_COMBO_69_17]